MEPVLTPVLCREARTLLDLDMAEVAFVARIPVSDLEMFEAGHIMLSAITLAALQRFFQRAGVVFAPGKSRRGVLLEASA